MFWKIAIGFFLVSFSILPAQAGELKVTINGVQSSEGALMIGLYDSASRFITAVNRAGQVALVSDPGRREGVTLRAVAGTQGAGFMFLPPGKYAIIVFHDQNDDGIMNKDMLGIPEESFGFSNNAIGFLGAPSFETAAVTMTDADKSISIDLVHPVTSAAPGPQIGK